MNQRDVLKLLSETAERFVNKAPKHAKLEEDRHALLDAIMQAQLLLSISPSAAAMLVEIMPARRTAGPTRRPQPKLVRPSRS